jgi:hypothetical protein
MPENATENKIYSAAHTQKLIANFSCPMCSKFGHPKITQKEKESLSAQSFAMRHARA